MKNLGMLICVFLAFWLSCSADASDNEQTIAGNINDANTVSDEGAATADNALGLPCTSSEPLSQGDCPSGLVCLVGVEGVTPFCTFSCDTPQECFGKNSGPGIGNCIMSLQVNDAVQNYCGIICEDLTDDDAACDGQCDGSCPAAMDCSLELRDESTGVVARGCM